MNTPIFDFVSRYIASGASRLHMPGHKGTGPLGCEGRDITEIAGAGELYADDGIIRDSERNASTLFGTGATFYATGGASQCVHAMLYLAMANRRGAGRPVALAARNAHKSFLHAAALCDFDVEWIYPEEASSLCACPVTSKALAARLDWMRERPFCVYVTSPDYLGGMQDIRALSKICRARDIPLLVDNAHGAYLKFLPQSLHPIDLGADMCCDSAHKTLPVLTGGAYLHIANRADPQWIHGAKAALSLFGSTSPSWLILQSLDLCNVRLAKDYPAAIAQTVGRIGQLKRRLSDRGFAICSGEPMKLTLRGDGAALAMDLRRNGAECEFADKEYAVLMFTPNNPDRDYTAVDSALQIPRPGTTPPSPAALKPPRAMTIRRAMFSPCETLPLDQAVGRICAAPPASCPPAVPAAVSGEVITPEIAAVLAHYGAQTVSVCKE